MGKEFVSRVVMSWKDWLKYRQLCVSCTRRAVSDAGEGQRYLP